jgi:hypothetical protein
MDPYVAEIESVQLYAIWLFESNVASCLSTLHDCESTDSVRRGFKKRVV